MHQRKILLLENVATQAAGVRERLAQAGFQVAVSRYESDGLKRLAEWGPDLVLVSTAHPAGDFLEYCRRVRALAPGVRLIVSSSLNRDRLFQQYPGLQALVDGVLLRPHSHEEVAAMLAAAPVVSRAPAVAPAVDPGTTDLRAEFQRQLDEKFLEVQEFKRRLEEANRRVTPAPEFERLKLENERLRQVVEESKKKTALAFATEQLKRSEVEVKLDNLLRMKEDFEFRVQNEIDDRTQEIEVLRGQLQELRERSGKEAGEHATLRVELERALVEKEQIEERLHTLEAAAIEQAVPQEAVQRIAALEAEVSRQRALEAEGKVALADMSAKLAILEDSLAREQAAREEREPLLAQIPPLREQLAEAERQTAELQAQHDGVRDRLVASEAARISVAAEAEAVVEQLGARCTSLAAGLGQERAARADAERRASDLEARLEAAGSLEAEAVTLRARVEDLGGELERLRAAETESLSAVSANGAEPLDRELEEATARARELTAERDRLTGLLEERQQAFDEEVRAWRERAAEAERERELLRTRQERGAAEREEERRGSTARLEKAVRDLEESERRTEALRGELAASAQAHDREARLLAEQAAAAEKKAEEAQQAFSRELEEKLAARAVPEALTVPVQAELRRIQELLEEVISRARNEAVDYARRDAELSVRLQAALEERRLLQERFDRAGAEATERERRSSSLLQSAIDHGPLRPEERANLPAVVPLNPGPATLRRRTVLAVLAVVVSAALLAVFGLRRTSPPAVLEQQQPVPRPQPGAPAGAAATPSEVWDRFTRSDTSGGVLVQATLRGEQELLAEVEAGRARGSSDEEVRAEFVRRLSAFRFDTTYYVNVYLKNLTAGYPAYFDDLPGRFRLRDSSGNEVPAFLPPGHDKDHRIFSFGAGAPADLIYEAAVSLGFDRAGLSPTAAYLQLVVSDVGAASRRVLTWELE